MTKFDQKRFTVVHNPQVSDEEVERRWNETFGKKQKKTRKKKPSGLLIDILKDDK